MIINFKCKETEKLFQRKFIRKIPRKLQRTTLRKLTLIHAAVSINDLRTPPGNRLEKLTGKRKNQHSIRINNQWRICFEWKVNHAYQVEIVDYH